MSCGNFKIVPRDMIYLHFQKMMMIHYVFFKIIFKNYCYVVTWYFVMGYNIRKTGPTHLNPFCFQLKKKKKKKKTWTHVF
jgi:hypothetical protein